MLDADDIMFPRRLEVQVCTRAIGPAPNVDLTFTDSRRFRSSNMNFFFQLEASKLHPNALIGSRFVRLPEDATPRYSAWYVSVVIRRIIALWAAACDFFFAH